MNTKKSKILHTSFRKFLHEINEAEPWEKQILADQFISKVKDDYPIYENDTTAVLLYQGKVDMVYLLGDMTDWYHFVPMTNIYGTNLFYHMGNYEPTARLEYWFTFEKNGVPIIDPLNKYKSLNGLGELSVLAMPGYRRHPLFENYEKGERGDYKNLIEHEVPSDYLKYCHTIHIYLPPNYDVKKKYASVYFQDGREYIEFAMVPHVLDSLINRNIIEPLIAVFVTPPNLHKPQLPNRMTEYDMNDKYVGFFAEELVKFIDANYSSSTERLVVGDSYGGLISAYISFMRPEVFRNAYSQSGYHSFFDDKMIELIKKSSKKDINLYIDIGTYERKVGASFLPADETDFLEANRRLKKILEDKEYEFVYKEYYEGHTWGNWRRHLINALIYFFPKRNI